MTRFHYANTNDGNMLYVTHANISDPFYFLEYEGKKYIFLSSTDIDAFKDQTNGEVEAVDVTALRVEASQLDSNVPGNLARVILSNYKVKGKIVVPFNFQVSIADYLREQGVELVLSSYWAKERELKSPAEISAISENFKNTLNAYRLLEQILKDSDISRDALMYKGEVLTSEFLKREISKCLLDYDLENKAGIIISCQNHAAMPHHQGSGPVKPNQTIIADIFPQSSKNHYFADMTRTYVKGKPSEKIVRMYDAVKEAQEASLSVLKPGVSCKDVYEISANSIRNHGFDVGDKGYIHSLGHGLGVDIHEKPNLSLRSSEVLKAGNIITIEPGLYYPDVGGMRIEDTVVITEDGYEDLTNFETDWIIP